MIARRIARPLLAASFVWGGIATLRNPGPQVAKAEPVAPAVADKVPLPLPTDTEQLVKINAIAQIVAGLFLAIGRLPRLAALVLAASIVPTTAAGHRFWEIDEPAQRAQQQIHFLKNAGLLGGLLLAALDTEGRPSLGWRARRAAHKVKEKATS